MAAKTIGILGGTFDPIHYGHLILAQNALEQFSLDKILFIPSGRSYMKESVTDAAIRYEMTALAISGNPDFIISDIEASRPGNSYTCETLEALKAQNPYTKYAYIIGADTLFSMESWYEPERIFAAGSILCAVRVGYDMEKLNHKKNELIRKYQADIQLLEDKSFDISSTEIRKRITQGKNVSYYLPESVIQYIREKNLYRLN